MGQTNASATKGRRAARPLVSASFPRQSQNGVYHQQFHGDRRGFAAAAATRESRSQRRSVFRRAPTRQPHFGVRRLGLNRLSALEPAEPVRRYAERAARIQASSFILISRSLDASASVGHRGSLPGRQTGVVNSPPRHRLFVHVWCIGDASRIASLQPGHEGREKESAVAFLSAGRRLLCESGRDDRARHDRQRFLLSVQGLRQDMQDAQPQAHPHEALQRPTARPSASSRPPCANGPTATHTTPQMNEPPKGCSAGTTIDGIRGP